eukprot:TRINITY_DN15159_c0_g1_i1.p1 TRINITY_DN15159_c0_g1~~TRINITY_DN15159_c0_g1_i1.p1  ORF type:complete len:189 (+),score=32.88 TRINITY_DN15159_c0_g1_i1:76-642(+)
MIISDVKRGADGTPELAEGEAPLFSAPNVTFHLGARSEGSGVLYITTRNLIWLDSTDPNKGYSVPFKSIGLHAISRNQENFPAPCIYCHLNANYEDDENAEVEELHLVPADQATTLEAIYGAMNQAASLNPDSDSDGEGDLYYNMNEVREGYFRMERYGDENEEETNGDGVANNGDDDDPDRYMNSDE